MSANASTHGLADLDRKPTTLRSEMIAAAQRTSMREEMMAMHSRMMGHMMEHLTAMPGMPGRMNRGQT